MCTSGRCCRRRARTVPPAVSMCCRGAASWEAAGGAEDVAVALRHDDFDLARVGAELHAVFGAGGAAALDAGTNLAAQLGDVARGVPDVAEDARRQLGEHGVELAVLGNPQREQEVVIGHEARFYSERWLNSTRARSQSAAICVRSASTDSNVRSSRSRCTKPTRIVVPYNSRSTPKMWVSVHARPDESTVGRTPMLVTDGRTTPSIVAMVA